MDDGGNVIVRQAVPADAGIVAQLTTELTREICEVCAQPDYFASDLALSERLARQWMDEGVYWPLLARAGSEAVGLAGLSETVALYAGGRIGVIQECYVAPAYRASGVGGRLMAAAFEFARHKHWSCLELCTPPLPQFAKAIDFYERYRFKPVGGRKMRCYLA